MKLILILFAGSLSAQVSVTIASNPTGQSFTVGGTGCSAGGYTAPHTLSWTAGASCSVSFVSPRSPSVGTRYVFNAWQDGPAANPRTIVAPSLATTYTVNFDTEYFLRTISNPGTAAGTISGSGWYKSGTHATLTAMPADEFRFLDWDSTPALTATTLDVLVALGPTTITANFVPLFGGIPPGNYSLVPIAIPGEAAGAPFSRRSINNYGQVAGTIINGPPTAGFLWTPVGPNAPVGSVIDLGSLPSSTPPGVNVANINNYGQVVGASRGQSFLWTPTAPNAASGNMIGFNTQTDSFHTVYHLNNFGEVAAANQFLWTPATSNGNSGTSTDQFLGIEKLNDYGQAMINRDSGTQTPLLFTPSTPHGLTGTLTPIPGVGAANINFLQDINSNGTIVGYNCPFRLGVGRSGCYQQQTFLWIPTAPHATTGTTTVLPAAFNIAATVPFLLNDFGQVFGSLKEIDWGYLHGFLWTPVSANAATGSLTRIDFPYGISAITPTAMNSSGQVIGTLTAGSGETAIPIPFLYSGGILYDLSALSVSLHRTTPADINDRGQIVVNTGAGLGVYLLTPSFPPAPLSAAPQSGSGNTQTMSFTFNDPRGWQDLGVVNVLINNFIDGRSACYLAYSVPSSTLYLVNDAGMAQGPYAGSIAAGSSSTIQNSQCTVGLTSAIGNANTLTLTLAVTFKPAFGGNRILYAAAGDASQNNSGWVPLGVWHVPEATQTTTAVIGTAPAGGTGFGPTPFTFQFSDTNGFADLGVENLLINTALDGRHACYLAYARPTNVMYLVNDTGTALQSGQSMATSGSLSNGQCAVSWGTSAVTTNGNNLSLAVNIGFSPGFGPNLVVYSAARSVNEANNTGWQASATWVVQ